jgi:hypothetical protein
MSCGLCLSGEVTQMNESGNRGLIPVWDRRLSFSCRIQTSLGVHSASFLMTVGTGALPTRVKRPGLEADHLTLVSRLTVHGTIHTVPHMIL